MQRRILRIDNLFLVDMNSVCWENDDGLLPAGSLPHACMAGAGPRPGQGQSQEPGARSPVQISHEGGKSTIIVSSPLPPRVGVSRKLESEAELEIKPRPFHMGCRLLNY